MGIVYQRRDEPARAVEYFDRARPHLGDSPMAIGTVDNNRGEALVALNDFDGARAAFESALANCEQADATTEASPQTIALKSPSLVEAAGVEPDPSLFVKW